MHISKFSGTEIDRLLGSAILKVPQQLTDAEKEQVKANLEIGAGTSPYFISFPTDDDYKAAKGEIEQECVVLIEDTGNIIWHTPSGSISTFIVTPGYMEFLGLMELDRVPLVYFTNALSSIVVNGEEMIDKVEELEPGSGFYSLMVTASVEDEFSVDFKLKEDIFGISYEMLGSTFYGAPIGHLVLNEDFAAALMTNEDPEVCFWYLLNNLNISGMTELTLNMEELIPFPSDASTGRERAQLMGNVRACYGEHHCVKNYATTMVMRYPNNPNYGPDYSADLSLEEWGFNTVMTAPTNVIEELLDDPSVLVMDVQVEKF